MQLKINDKTNIEIINEFNEKEMNFSFPFIFSTTKYLLENFELNDVPISKLKDELDGYNKNIKNLSDKGIVYHDILKYAYYFKITEERKEKIIKLKEKINNG